jgi:aminotransferase
LAASKKLNLFTESVIREMTRLSDQYGAINLSQGMPDFIPSPKLVEAAVDAIRRGPNQYSITWGHRGLREAIARKAQEYNKIDADPEKNVTVTCGSTEAVASAVLALTNPGDRIVVTDPFYENYVPDAILAGCELLYVPLKGRALDLDENTWQMLLPSPDVEGNLSPLDEKGRRNQDNPDRDDIDDGREHVECCRSLHA